MLPMPHFFFNVRDSRGCRTDCKGQDIPDLESARLEALKAAKAIWGDQTGDGPREVRSIEVKDEADRRVMIVPYH
jgi:hypothetical protein